MRHFNFKTDPQGKRGDEHQLGAAKVPIADGRNKILQRDD